MPETDIVALIQNLADAEQKLADAVGGQVDVILLPDTDIPILLQQARLSLLDNYRELRAVFDSALDAILMVDAHQTILDANPAACTLTGFARDALIGKPLSGFPAPDYDFAQQWRELLARGSLSGEFAIYRQDGTLRHIAFSAVANFVPGKHLVIARDTTTTYNLNKEMRAQSRNLKTRAHELELLYAQTHDLAGEHDVKTALDKILERARDLLDAEFGLIALARSDRYVEIVTAHNSPYIPGMRIVFGEGVSGIAAAERKTIIVNDYLHWRHRLPQSSDETPRALVGTPMLYRGELLGVLVLGTARDGHLYSENDAHLLEMFATQAAGVVQSTRLLEQARARNAQLEELYQTGLALNKEHDAQAQLNLLLNAAVHALQVDRGAFWSYDAERNALNYEIAFGSPSNVQHVAQTMHFSLDDTRGLAALVARTRTPLYIPDVQNDPRWIPTEPELKSAMWAPVVHQNTLFGVLSVASETLDKFSASDVQVLVLYANQFASALENARLVNELRHSVQQLQALHMIDNAISASFDLRLIMQVYLDVVQNELHADAVDVLVFDAKLLQLRWAGGRGFYGHGREGHIISLHEPLLARAATEWRVVSYPDPTQNLMPPDFFRQENFQTYVGVPLISKGQLKGIMEIFQRTPVERDGAWSEFLQVLSRQAALAIDNVELFEALQKSNAEQRRANDETIAGWARALNLRDRETPESIQTLTDLTLQLARRLGIPKTEADHIRHGALLHDIGNMGIPDAILNKPGPLTPDEWTLVKQHPQFAHDLLAPIAFLRPALHIPYCHHERWDGSGYPRGIAGEEIPLAARAFAVVDVWVALTRDRPYRPAMTPQQAQAHLRAERGKQFDPAIVNTFLEMLEEQTNRAD